ncbi:hypothetical protein [Agrococcus sp. ProA11]
MNDDDMRAFVRSLFPDSEAEAGAEDNGHTTAADDDMTAFVRGLFRTTP